MGSEMCIRDRRRTHRRHQDGVVSRTMRRALLAPTLTTRKVTRPWICAIHWPRMLAAMALGVTLAVLRLPTKSLHLVLRLATQIARRWQLAREMRHSHRGRPVGMRPSDKVNWKLGIRSSRWPVTGWHRSTSGDSSSSGHLNLTDTRLSNRHPVTPFPRLSGYTGKPEPGRKPGNSPAR